MSQNFHIIYCPLVNPLDLNCVAKFSSTGVVFQNLASRRTIGSAYECEGLYRFDDHEIVQG